jgi:hypothetical protein
VLSDLALRYNPSAAAAEPATEAPQSGNNRQQAEQLHEFAQLR